MDLKVLRISQDFTGFHEILMDFIGFYKILMDFSRL